MTTPPQPHNTSGPTLDTSSPACPLEIPSLRNGHCSSQNILFPGWLPEPLAPPCPPFLLSRADSCGAEASGACSPRALGPHGRASGAHGQAAWRLTPRPQNLACAGSQGLGQLLCQGSLETQGQVWEAREGSEGRGHLRKAGDWEGCLVKKEPPQLLGCRAGSGGQGHDFKVFPSGLGAG